MTMVTAAAETDLVNRLRTLYRTARKEKSGRYDNWYRNYRLVMNRSGTQAFNSNQIQARSSEIYPILSTLVSWMNDQHTTIDVTAAADPDSDFATYIQKVAQDLSTVLTTNWEVENYDNPKKLAIWDSLIYGTGFLKTVWDQSLAGGLGNANLIHIDPFQLFIDPNATSLKDAEYIVEVRRMSLDEIERRFPGKSILAEGSSATTGEVDEKPTYSSGSNAFRSPKANPGALPGGDGRYAAPTSGPRSNLIDPGVIVYEFWLRENETWYEDEDAKVDNAATAPEGLSDKHVTDKWRVVVLAANEILLDEDADDLWSGGTHPYDRFVFDDVGELYGISLVDHLANPQIALNRLLDSMQKSAELTGNPIFLEAANSGLDRVGIINKPGQRLRITGTGGLANNKPGWMQPPQPSEVVRQLMQFWIERMENISGLTSAIKGADMGQRQSQDALGSNQDIAFVRVRNALSNLEETLKSAGNKLADLVIDNYTDPRYIAIVGPDGEKSSLVLRARHFNIPTDKGAIPLKYVLSIQAGSSMPTSRQAKASQAQAAYALGIIDRQAWFEANQYPNWQAINKRINEEIKAGTFQPPSARQRAGRQQ